MTYLTVLPENADMGHSYDGSIGDFAGGCNVPGFAVSQMKRKHLLPIEI